MFVCYVDHKATSLQELGEVILAPDTLSRFRSARVAILSTCQRLEFYAVDRPPSSLIDLFKSLRPRHRTISGRRAVLTRLTRIAAGTESLLLGDPFVRGQVEQAFRHVPHDSELGFVARTALNVAGIAGLEQSFFSQVDYAKLTIRLLNSRASGFDQVGVALVVAGAGTLGMAVAGHDEAARYERVFLVSQYAKKLRPAARAVRYITPADLPVAIAGRPFDFVIATTSTNQRYIEILEEVALDSHCRAIIHFSPTRFHTPELQKKYVHEYDQEFCNLLAVNSIAVSIKLPLILATIDRHLLDYPKELTIA